MLRLASYDIVFQEVPGEITLALNLSGCPNRCPGCHSAHLQGEVGEPLDEALLGGLVERYGGGVSCVGFMGGDGDPAEVNRLAGWIRAGRPDLKTAWYSGRSDVAPEIGLHNFDFIKTGPYTADLGGLDSPATNQRFYRIESENNEKGESDEMDERGKRDEKGRKMKMIDITGVFKKKTLPSQSLPSQQ